MTRIDGRNREMEPTLRASLVWVHTWTGVILGALLFALFWTGALSVFDREIDRWMAPATRLPPSNRSWSLDSLRDSYHLASVAKASTWSVTMPSERQPFLVVSWRGLSGAVEQRLNPQTGEQLPDPQTLAGTGFFYPFHYMLHIKSWRFGQWLVGLAAMSMLALCVSGLVIHRRLLADFFLLRSPSNPRRRLLDLHTVTAVMGLPFLVVITMSGLSIAWPVYFPGSLWMTYGGGRSAFNRDAYGLFERPRHSTTGALASFDEMTTKARAIWSGAHVRSFTVWYPDDAGAYVQIVLQREDAVAGSPGRVYFDAATGQLLHQTGTLLPILKVDRFVAGLHEIQFRHWTLRWLYFALGLMGCVTIATGYLFWLESRRKRHAQLELKWVRIVEGLTVGSTTGLIVGTLAFFVANRALPLGVALAGYDRVALESGSFFLAWLASLGHAWFQPAKAWIGQCWAIGGLALAATILNWVTTGDHLARSLAHRHLWPIAGMDILLLLCAATAIAIACRLRREISQTSALEHKR